LWYEKLLTELSPQLTVLNLYLQGEPFLHPDFTKMVKMASNRNIYVITSTNGQHFNEQLATDIVESGLSEIYFSLDGLTQHTYEKYRKGGDLEKIKDGIRALSRAKDKLGKRNPYIVAQFIVFKHNEHEVAGFKKMAFDLGADKAEIKSAQFNDFSSDEVKPPQSNQFKRYDSASVIGFKNHKYNHCWKSWMSAVFTWDGKVLPCCFDKDGDYELGNVTEDSFNTIWEGTRNSTFRGTILKSKNKISICSNCPEGRSFFT
jgi:radical SAM protein with 4Fe4S-binding SPASM domain